MLAIRRVLAAFASRVRRAFDIARFARRHEDGSVGLARKTVHVLRSEGPRGILRRIRHLRLLDRTASGRVVDYARWLRGEYQAGDSERARDISRDFRVNPKVSVLMPLSDPDEAALRSALASVVAQVYGNWELCVIDVASSEAARSVVAGLDDGRIRFTQVGPDAEGKAQAAPLSAACSVASGDFVAILHAEDQLSPFALFWFVEKLNREPGLNVIYSDEDTLDARGERCQPFFKPDWNYDLLLSGNYVGGLTLLRASLLREFDAIRAGNADDYDLVLRAIEGAADEVGHVPRVLYHRRKATAHPTATAGALDAGKRALQGHLARTGARACVVVVDNTARVQFMLPARPPKVTLIIPTKDAVDLLRACVDSVLTKTSYPDYEILIIDNNSVESRTLAYLDEVSKRDNVAVRRDAGPFNFAALNNRAIESCQADYVCLLNNDVEVIAEDWLSDMMSNALRSDVGVVGALLLFREHTVQHAGITLGIGGVAGHSFKHAREDEPRYRDRIQVQQQVAAVTGACMVIERAVFGKVGGLDEAQLGVAFNDVDFCLKVAEAGYKVVYTPSALLYHRESSSRGQDDDSPTEFARLQRERQVMMDRWGALLRNDPAYNPNLTLDYTDFAMASVSRNPTISELLERLPSRSGETG